MRYLLIGFLLFVISCADKQHKRTEQNISIHKSESLFLPDDLQVTLWAETPMLHNPTNMDVDAKGRLWITEAVNYRTYNNKDSGTLHRQKGDRIVILEDTNRDGKADISKTFIEDEDLISPVGIAVLGSRIVVSCSPNLIVYTDENGDDVPDKKEIILTGFGGKDHDHSLHAVYAGPDGNWYFNVGNAGPHTVTDKAGFTLRSGSMYTGGSPYNDKNEGARKSDDGKVWVGGLALRINPDGTGLKVMGHNFRNSYEVIPDSYGNLWQNDNDDQVVTCRTTWLMEGGNAGFFSTDGTRSWQADQRPGQNIFSAHWHQDDPGVMPAGDNSGTGAPTGVTIIEGDELGKQYRGMLLSADAGRNIIFGYHPSVSGSGFDLGDKKYFISSSPDSNERYVWNDTSHAAHLEKWFRPSDVTIGTDGSLFVADWYDPVVGGHQMQDTRGYGRIYRITNKNTKPTLPVIDLTTAEGQIAALKSPAINVRNEGFRKLQHGGEKNIDLIKALLKHENPYIRARAIWLLSKLGAGGIREVEQLLDHSDELIRATAYRALRQSVADIVPYAEKMASDRSSFVRREVIVSLSSAAEADSLRVLIELAKKFDGSDRWYLESLGSAVESYSSDFYKQLKKELNEDDPSAWTSRMEMLAWRLHPVESLEDLKVRATSASSTEKSRENAITAIAFIRDRRAADAMISLTGSTLPDVAENAKYWIAFRQTNDWRDFIDRKKIKLDTEYERRLAEMKVHTQMLLDDQQSEYERKWHANAMVKDSLGAQMLIGLAADKTLPQLIRESVTSALLQHSDASIRVQAAAYFAGNASNAKYDVKNILSLPTNASNGKRIFEAKCSNCHTINGKGSRVGPELTGAADKFNNADLLQAIIDPNRSIVFGYEPWLVTKRDNETVYGFLVSDNDELMVVRDLTGRDHAIRKQEVSNAKKQDNSVMPSAAQNELTEQQLADVLGYLKE